MKCNNGWSLDMDVNLLRIKNVGHLHQRGIGDLIERKIVDHYVALGGSRPSSSKSIEDFSYNQELYDVKTIDLNSKFLGGGRAMISIPRAAGIRLQEMNIIECLYEVKNGNVVVKHVSQFKMHEIPWNQLSIQNNGRGCLMRNGIDNGERFNGTKEDWYQIFDTKARDFYAKMKVLADKYLASFEEIVASSQAEFLLH